MLLKLYSYHVHPDRIQDMLAIQQQASHVYARHVACRFALLRHREDRSRWLEIQWFPDEQSYKNGMEAVDADPEISELWEAFQETLDPDDRAITEEMYEQVWVSE